MRAVITRNPDPHCFQIFVITKRNIDVKNLGKLYYVMAGAIASLEVT